MCFITENLTKNLIVLNIKKRITKFIEYFSINKLLFLPKL